MIKINKQFDKQAIESHGIANKQKKLNGKF